MIWIFSEVVRMAEGCVPDSELLPEEVAIINEMKFLIDDTLPDACACRVKLGLHFHESGIKSELNPIKEAANYLQREHLVSGDLRLTFEEQVK
jgi:hypothetical protein